MQSIIHILHKNFQEDHTNSRRFPGFPGVVDTLSSLLHEIRNHIRLEMVFVIVISISQWFSSSPEEPVVSILQCGEISLSTQAEVKVWTRRRPRKIERATVEELAQLRETLLILGRITQRDKRSAGYAKYVGLVNSPDRDAANNQHQTEHRLISYKQQIITMQVFLALASTR